MRFLILGGGAVTAEYYLTALRIMGRVADAIVVDPDAASLKERHPEFLEADFRAQDYRAFLESLPSAGADRSEGIIVALPNHLHVDAVRGALNSGRDVLCEKPLALRAADVSKLRAIASERARLLKVAMSRRYLPALMLARDIVASEEMGAVQSIEAQDCAPFGWRPRSFSFFAPEAGGVLADMGVHYLDYVATLVGELTPIAYGDDAKGGNESSAEYALRAGDIPVHVRLSRIHQSGAYIKIRCTRGEIAVDKTNESEILVKPLRAAARRVSAETPFERPEWPNEFHGGFCQMLADYEAEVMGETTRIADAADAEKTVALIEWAYERRRQNAPRTYVRAEGGGRDKALVTGGTGFIGGHLLERLSTQPLDIRLAARSPANCANAARFPVAIEPTDLLDFNSVRRAVAGARCVYHLAYGNSGRDAARVTIEGTRNVVEAAIAEGAECVLVLSTMYVFGFPQGQGVIDESFPYRLYGGEYGESKATMEKWCLARAKTSLPTRIVILNPTCVFGPGGGAYTRLPIDLAALGQFCWIDEGSGSCNYNYVDNLIDAILAAVATPRAHGERFIINDGVATWRDVIGPFVDPIARQIPSYSPEELKKLRRFGGPFRATDLLAATISAPEVRNVVKRSAFARKVFAFYNRINPKAPMGAEPIGPVTRQEIKSDPPDWLGPLYGPAHAEFSSAKAEKVFGWRPRISLKDAQAETIRWLVENGRLPSSAAIECN